MERERTPSHSESDEPLEEPTRNNPLTVVRRVSRAAVSAVRQTPATPIAVSRTAASEIAVLVPLRALRHQAADSATLLLPRPPKASEMPASVLHLNPNPLLLRHPAASATVDLVGRRRSLQNPLRHSVARPVDLETVDSAHHRLWTRQPVAHPNRLKEDSDQAALRAKSTGEAVPSRTMSLTNLQLMLRHLDKVVTSSCPFRVHNKACSAATPGGIVVPPHVPPELHQQWIQQQQQQYQMYMMHQMHMRMRDPISRPNLLLKKTIKRAPMVPPVPNK